jgi:hypothetical protein
MITENGFVNLLAYVGVVQMVEERGDGRIKVRAFGFHPTGEIADEDLPWAYMVNGTYGKFHAWPKRGDMVFGFFLDGRDAQHPIVIGTMNQGVATSMPHDAVGSTQDASNYDTIPVDAATPGGRPLTPEEEEAAWKRLEAQEAERRAAAGLPREFSAEERAAIRGILASEGGSAAGNLAVILNRSYQSSSVTGSPISVIDVVFATNQFTPAAAASIGVNDVIAGSDSAGAGRFLGGYTNSATLTLTSAIDGYVPILDQGTNYFNAASLGIREDRIPVLNAGNIYQVGNPGNFGIGGESNFEVFLDRNNLRN